MAKRVPAGEMRHLVTIEQGAAETTYDSYGQLTTASSSDWTAVLTNWRAKIEALSGREAEIAHQVYPNATHQVTLDYNSNLNSTGATRMRVNFGDRYLYIGAILNEDMENLQLQLLCGEDR